MRHTDRSGDNDLKTAGTTEYAALETNINVAKGLLLLLGTLLAGLFLTSILTASVTMFTGEGTRLSLLCTSAIQAVCAFIIPAVVTMRMMGKHPLRNMCVTRGVPLSALWGLVIVAGVALPALDQIIYWNQHMTFGPALADFEVTLRKMEELNSQVGAKLMETTSVGGLISGVLVVGVLTGIAEEFFFRGAMQRIFTGSGVNHHVAIWVSAIIFSAIHFQFFGFFPRLLMGAWFGYLLWWTKSVWTSVIAHALNNSLVVITAWQMARGTVNADIENLGVTFDGFPWPALASALVTAAMIGSGLFFRPKWRMIAKKDPGVRSTIKDK